MNLTMKSQRDMLKLQIAFLVHIQRFPAHIHYVEKQSHFTFLSFWHTCHTQMFQIKQILILDNLSKQVFKGGKATPTYLKLLCEKPPPP